MTIQIEEGKFYKRADGSVHGPAREKGGDPLQPYPWRVGNGTYTSAGKFYADQVPFDLDLIAEVPHPDQHAAETVEGKPDVEDDGFITRDTPEWAAAVEQEAAEEKLTLEAGKFYRTRAGEKVGPLAYNPHHYRTEFPFFYEDGIGRDKSYFAWRSDGTWNLSRSTPHDLDIIAEITTTADPADIKTVIADEAKRIVSGARRSAYGKPEANFERIARFWQAYFENTGRADIKVTAADVSPLMRLMKEARLAESPSHYDSFVDLIGYTLTGAEVNQVQKPA